MNGPEVWAEAARTDGFLVGSHPHGQIELQDWMAEPNGPAWAFDEGAGGTKPTTAALPVHRDDEYRGFVADPNEGEGHFAFHPIGKP
ncbi:hypothetical protein ACIBSV_43030 [Embleya sp. NPDC050154]|uniref:hypothetical protein n=1 Tax=unclassified Embleya TaxID=2699296 RepID=UPI0037A70387